MNLQEKLARARLAVESIARHDDEPPARREQALKQLVAHVEAELAETKGREAAIEAQVKESLGAGASDPAKLADHLGALANAVARPLVLALARKKGPSKKPD